MGFDSELEDSDPDCDVEGQRIDPVRVANLKTASILGMISNKIYILTIFGHKQFKHKFLIKRFGIFHAQMSSILINTYLELNYEFKSILLQK